MVLKVWFGGCILVGSWDRVGAYKGMGRLHLVRVGRSIARFINDEWFRLVGVWKKGKVGGKWLNRA